MIAERSNVVVHVMFLAWVEGLMRSHLILHTNKGVFTVPVTGTGVRNPYGVNPVIDAQVRTLKIHTHHTHHTPHVMLGHLL